MTMKSTGNSGRFLNEDWHDRRQDARESLGKFEFGDIDIAKYDLDDIQFDRKARKTTTEPRIDAEGSPKAGEPLQGHDTDDVRD